MSIREQVPFNQLQSKRLMCRLFLKNNFIYRNIFSLCMCAYLKTYILGHVHG